MCMSPPLLQVVFMSGTRGMVSMLKRCGAVRRLLVMGTKERVGACEELLGYWNGVNG